MATKYFRTSAFLTKFGSRDSWGDYVRACVSGSHALNILDEDGCAFIVVDRNYDNEYMTSTRTYSLFVNAPTLGYTYINSDVKNQSPYPMIDTTITGTKKIDTTRPIGQWSALISFTYSKYRSGLGSWAYEKTGNSLPRDFDGAVWIDLSQLPYYYSDDPDLEEKAKKYIDTGDYSGAENAEELMEQLYAIWTVGYTNSNDTIYSVACNCPQFYDPNSRFYGLANVASIRLTCAYSIGESLTTVYRTNYQYGDTWSGQLSKVIGYDQESIANQIAEKIADFMNFDTLMIKFEVSVPDSESDDGYTDAPEGYVEFNHARVNDYGFTENYTLDEIHFKSGVVLDDEDSDISNPDPDKEESDTETDPTISDITGSGLLTKTYMLTPQEAQGIGAFLWGADYMTNIRLLTTSPIENVISCKLFPFEVTGQSANVVIGNVDSLTTADVIEKNVIKKTSNALSVPHFYKTQADNLEFLDFDPYTKVEIFLPFIGIKELPTDIVMGGTLKIQWFFDLVCGTVETHVLCNSPTDRGTTNSGYHTLMIFNSQCGADIPLTAQNLSQVQSAYIQNAIGGGISLASGNIAGVVQSMAGAVTTQYHSQTHGTPSPNTTVQTDLTPFIKITRPFAKIQGTNNEGASDEKPCKVYRKLMGAPLYEVYTLGTLDGYSEIENPQIAVAGALKEEVDEINRLLAEGVILTKYSILGAQ